MLISFQIRQNEEIDGCYEMKAVYIYIYIYIYIYGGETGLAPIMYVMGINILIMSYLVSGRKNRSYSSV